MQQQSTKFVSTVDLCAERLFRGGSLLLFSSLLAAGLIYIAIMIR